MVPATQLPAVLRFEIYDDTLIKLREFQEEHPDVTIEEASNWINSCILKMLEEYKDASESCS